MRNEKLWLPVLGPGAFPPCVSLHWQTPLLMTDTRQSHEGIVFQEYEHVAKSISRTGPQPHLCTPGLTTEPLFQQSGHGKAKGKLSLAKNSFSLLQTVEPVFSFIFFRSLLTSSGYSTVLLVYCQW